MQLSPLPRFLVKALVRSVMAVLFLGLPMVLVYAKIFGIGFGFPDRVSEALSGPSLETKISRVSLDLIEGLVAEDVALFSSNDEPREIARINRVAIALNLSALLGRRIVVDRITLDRARAEIPVSGKNDQTALNLKIEDLDASISMLDSQIRISGLEGLVQGVRIKAQAVLQSRGGLIIPKSGGTNAGEGIAGGSGAGADFAKMLRRCLETLESLEFPGAPPTVTFQVGGDADNKSSLVIAPISIRCGPVVGRGWRFEKLEAEARYADGELRVERLLIQDRNGQLTAWASARDKTLELEGYSTLDPAPLARAFSKNDPLKDFSFAQPPNLTLRASVDFTKPVAVARATGQIALNGFEFRGVRGRSLKAEFAWREGKLFVREARIALAAGEAVADLLIAPDDFRVRASSTLDPTAIAPLLSPKDRATINEMEFKDKPVLKVSLRGARPDFLALTGNGTMQLGRTAMRGVWIEEADSRLEFENGAITYRNFRIERETGSGSGNFTYDIKRQLVALDGVVSTLNPVEIMMWIDPKIAESIRPYRFVTPPNVRAGGTIYMKDISKNDLALQVESAEGLEYDLLGKTLRFGKTSATVTIDGANIRAKVPTSRLMGGDVSVTANISIDPKRPVFDADVSARRVDFAKITKLYFDYEGSGGVGSGKYKFTSKLGQESDMRGQGSIRVEAGNVFAIPILGPLSDIMHKIIPGVGYQTARLATADFRIADKKIESDNLEIQGAGFAMFGAGTIFFTTDRMDMSMRINAKGIPGIVFFPVSKLFEYVSTGTVSNPEWRPKILPRFPPATNGR